MVCGAQMHSGASSGGTMAANTAQERGGLRQATQLVGAGAPGRLRRDVLRQYVLSMLLFASVLSHPHTRVWRIAYFGLACTRTQVYC